MSSNPTLFGVSYLGVFDDGRIIHGVFSPLFTYIDEAEAFKHTLESLGTSEGTCKWTYKIEYMQQGWDNQFNES